MDRQVVHSDCYGPLCFGGDICRRMAKHARRYEVKLAIFSKGGTLNTTVSGEPFLRHPHEQALLPGVAKGLAAMAATDGDLMFAITSNQQGLISGDNSMLKAVETEMLYYLDLLPPGIIARCYFCSEDGLSVWGGDWRGFVALPPPTTHKEVRYQAPEPGMLLLAMQEAQINDRSNVIFIGDRPEDEQAAAAAGVAFQWSSHWRSQYIGARD